MKLHDLAPAPGSRKKAIRVGRGRAGRRGKTAGRGQKGAKARGQIPASYEGGQMPLHMRLPKLPGFRNINRIEYTVVNLDGLDRFDANDTIDPESLRSKGLVRKKGPVKVLGRGEVTKALNIKAQAFSDTAVRKIEAAGGSTQVV
ncbi:MAG: 50S ribosomal protein L15 [Actinomycetota bacterium]|nr:50S ribosomal protein L15 [Actinomycetota bacterium]